MNPGTENKRGLEIRHVEIEPLSGQLKAALAAACTERQREVYRTYARRTGSPVSAAFDELLDGIWHKIVNRQGHGPREHMEWQGRAERMYPGKEAKEDLYKGCAQIAVLGLLCTNQVLSTGETEYVCHAGHEALMSIYNWLPGPGQPKRDLRDPNMFAKVVAHPLYHAEHLRQVRDFNEVSQAALRQETIPDMLNRLRQRSAIEAMEIFPLLDVQRNG